MSQRLAGKTAFVTAAAQGIGRACADLPIRQKIAIAGPLPRDPGRSAPAAHRPQEVSLALIS